MSLSTYAQALDVPGTIDAQFLDLPDDVIVSVMRNHQRYLAVRDTKTKKLVVALALLARPFQLLPRRRRQAIEHAGIDSVPAIIRLNNICNDLGLDTSSTGATLSWAFELYQRGIITKEHTGGIELHWGDAETIEKLLFMLTRREGFGNVLADSTRAVEKGHYPPEALRYRMAVKGLMQSDPHDARILKAFALGLAVATRGMDHLRNRVTLEINARINDDPAFIRAVTTPRRGIGQSTLEVLGAFSGQWQCSLFEAVFKGGIEAKLNDRQLQPLRDFCNFINDLEARASRPGPSGSGENAAAVLDDMMARYNVDRKRVFVLGHSNGGFMAEGSKNDIFALSYYNEGELEFINRQGLDYYGRTLDELQTFLTKLARAITTGDGQAAARLWEVPAFVIGDDMAMPLTDPEQIADFFGGARAEYNANGITDTHPQILTVDWISDKLCVVKVRWPYLDSEGR